jgi:hypothetical protein
MREPERYPRGVARRKPKTASVAPLPKSRAAPAQGPTRRITLSPWCAVALVLQRDLRLHDRDRHFEHLPQIVRV